MMEIFDGLDVLLKTFWFIAIPASTVFIIQMILTFTGSDAGDGLSADFDGDLSTDDHGAFQLFSLRNLVNFLLGFGWTGISLYEVFENKSILVIMATLVGVAFVMMFFYLIRVIHGLGEDNTFSIQSALNKTGSVYLSIPASKSGMGKVQVSIHGSVHELNAVTEGEHIPTGCMIVIKEIISNDLLLVEKI